MNTQPMEMGDTIQDIWAWTRRRGRDAQHAVHHAKLAWLMPDANRLTRTITAAILESRGLLGEPPGLEVHPTTTSILFTQARFLRREMERLCAQSKALCGESERLCKDRQAPMSWGQAPEQGS
jgi:hypothetical protein